MSSNAMSIIMLVGLLVIMYLLLIRPQRKREKQINNMRNNIRVGDQVVTIGGVIGKVVKTGSDSLIVQLGDKTKVEIMRWGISKDITAEQAPPAADKEFTDEETEEPVKKHQKPKRMKRPDAGEEGEEHAEERPQEENAEPEERDEGQPAEPAEEEKESTEE